MDKPVVSDAMIEAGVKAAEDLGWEDVPEEDVAAIYLAMTAASPTCPTCGVAKIDAATYCSDGFHAPGPTYWPASPAQEEVARG